MIKEILFKENPACHNPEHSPDYSNLSLKMGIYRHICPACGKETVFAVRMQPVNFTIMSLEKEEPK